MIDKVKRFASKNKICQYIINVMFLVYSYMFAFLCLCMRIFPIQENKIVCCNMKGKRYGDNPKYITDELLKRNAGYEIVWLLKDDVDEELPKGIRRIKYTVFSIAYEIATAKIWIDSNTKQYGTLKRKKQIYIQTWHGSYGLKKVYGDLLDKITFIPQVTMKYNSKITDLYISNSKKTSEIYRRAFWYSGNILECGSPRNDIFFQRKDDYLKKVQKHFNIEGKKIVLYAPTYRENFSTKAFQLNYYQLKNNLEKRFGEEWVILVRLHPQNIQDAEKFIKYDNQILNATSYSIMQELLVASDVLVTDYSSCMFDFVTKGKPCFLYATDTVQYKESRGYYYALEDLPFPLATNNEELEKVILEFNEQEYKERLEKLFKEVGLCESGEASKQVVDYIERLRKDR